MDDKKKNLLGMLIPVITAVLVVVVFAISGHITKNMDAVEPTAPAPTEEQTTEPVTQASSKVALVAVGEKEIL